MNLSFEVAKLEQERFYLNGWKAGALGEECPPRGEEGWKAGQESRAKVSWFHIVGMRAGLAGEPVPEMSGEAMEKGWAEGAKVRASILGAAQAFDYTDGFHTGAKGFGLKHLHPYPTEFMRGFNAGKDIAQQLHSLRHEAQKWRAAALAHADQGDESDAELKALRERQADEQARLKRAETYATNKATEWASVLAGDFDPFDETWTEDEQRGGERALGLFAEKLRGEEVPCPTAAGAQLPGVSLGAVGRHLRWTEGK